VGTDWDNYHNLYKGSFRGEETVIESGYNLLSSAVSLVSEDYTTFLLVHACIIYTLFVSTIQKIAVAPLLSMLIFYCLMLRYLGMNRQYLAVAICFFSLRYIIARKPLGFLICLALALSFHRTALLFLPAYFLVGKIDLRVLLACIVGTALLGFTGLGDKLEPRIFLAAGEVIVERLYFYKDLDMFDLSATGIASGLAKRCLILLASGFLLYNGRKKQPPENIIAFNLYWLGFLLFLIFNGTELQIIVARGLIYFNIMEVFLIGIIVVSVREQIAKMCIFGAVAVYGFVSMERGIDFYKDHLGIDIFRPYKSAFERKIGTT
jgi:hypothetical protein